MADVADEESDASAYSDAPEEQEIPKAAVPFWEAWHHLAFDRQYVPVTRFLNAGAGTQGVTEVVPMPIPFGAVDRYATRFGFEGARFACLWRIVKALDEEYRAWDHENRGRQPITFDHPET